MVALGSSTSTKIVFVLVLGPRLASVRSLLKKGMMEKDNADALIACKDLSCSTMLDGPIAEKR